MLTKTQRQQILDKVEQCYVTCERHYHRTYPRPTTYFDVRGAKGGYAVSVRNELHFHPVLAAENFDHYIAQTVPHEVAHIIDYHNRQHNTDPMMNALNEFMRGRRKKRDIHGPSWKAVMGVLGVPATRCHSYDTTNVKIQKTKYMYRCGCAEPISVGPKVHNRIRMRGATYRCRPCGQSFGTLNYIATQAPVRLQAITGGRPRTGAPGSLSAPRPESKIDQAIQLVHTHRGLDRNQLIDTIARNLNMSRAGAQTYYYLALKRG